jgi:thiol-disulfide isomerase/thioredoxin
MAACLFVATACDRSATGEPLPGRSESIAAADSMPIAVLADSSPSQRPDPQGAGSHTTPAAPRKLCETELGRAGRRLPKGTFTPVAAAGVEPPANRVTNGSRRWTWINFFAAWCGPCKEEMPRLRTFQQRLQANLDVTFVSVDDDERQLKKFLADQPSAGVRAALWLEPKPRDAWLSALHMKNPPDLPAHVLVDPSGAVRCIVGGAVEEADFAAIAAIVKP